MNEIHNSNEMSYIDERTDAQYMVDINNRLGCMSYIRRCGYVNNTIGIYHDDGLNTWIKFEIMDEIDYLDEIKIFDKVGFIINCIHVVCFIIHVINFVHLSICIHVIHLH
jgi:hypothetical protein